MFEESIGYHTVSRSSLKRFFKFYCSSKSNLSPWAFAHAKQLLVEIFRFGVRLHSNYNPGAQHSSSRNFVESHTRLLFIQIGERTNAAVNGLATGNDGQALSINFRRRPHTARNVSGRKPGATHRNTESFDEARRLRINWPGRRSRAQVPTDSCSNPFVGASGLHCHVARSTIRFYLSSARLALRIFAPTPLRFLSARSSPSVLSPSVKRARTCKYDS